MSVELLKTDSSWNVIDDIVNEISQQTIRQPTFHQCHSTLNDHKNRRPLCSSATVISLTWSPSKHPIYFQSKEKQ